MWHLIFSFRSAFSLLAITEMLSSRTISRLNANEATFYLNRYDYHCAHFCLYIQRMWIGCCYTVQASEVVFGFSRIKRANDIVGRAMLVLMRPNVCVTLRHRKRTRSLAIECKYMGNGDYTVYTYNSNNSKGEKRRKIGVYLHKSMRKIIMIYWLCVREIKSDFRVWSTSYQLSDNQIRKIAKKSTVNSQTHTDASSRVLRLFRDNCTFACLAFSIICYVRHPHCKRTHCETMREYTRKKSLCKYFVHIIHICAIAFSL